MRTVIDLLNSISGWSASDALKCEVHGTNDHDEFIAGLDTDKSLILRWLSGGQNSYIEKTGLSINISDLNELTFHIWSRNKKYSGVDYQKTTDFNYTLSIDDSNTFYIPTYHTFSSVTIDISDIDLITKIRFTSLHNDEDYLLISYMVGVKNELPRDIFSETKLAIESLIDNQYTDIENGVADKGILSGTISGETNDTKVVVSGNGDFLRPYTVVYIDDGVNTETHQVKTIEYDEIEDITIIEFNTNYDGEDLTNDFTDASLYVQISVEFGLREDDVRLPGISIWGFAPEAKYISNKEDKIRDTMTSSGINERTTGQLLSWSINIIAEAYHYELLTFMSKIIRKLISREHLWLNGRRHDITFKVNPVLNEAIEAYNEIPQIQYVMGIDLIEDIWDNAVLVPVTTITQTQTANLANETGGL